MTFLEIQTVIATIIIPLPRSVIKSMTTSETCKTFKTVDVENIDPSNLKNVRNAKNAFSHENKTIDKESENVKKNEFNIHA
jgi:hypothetical protein